MTDSLGKMATECSPRKPLYRGGRGDEAGSSASQTLESCKGGSLYGVHRPDCEAAREEGKGEGRRDWVTDSVEEMSVLRASDPRSQLHYTWAHELMSQIRGLPSG